MPTPPFAQLTIVVNGGAPQTGRVRCSQGDNVQLGAGNSNAGTFLFVFPAASIPDGWTAPAGWSTDGGGNIYWAGNTPTPPAFALPSLASGIWGNWLPQLIVNQGVPASNVGLVDNTTSIQVLSPVGKLWDVAGLEQAQVGGSLKAWAENIQQSLRAIEAFAGGGSPAPGVNVTGTVLSFSRLAAVDTSGGSFALTFPLTPTDGQVQIFKDATGNFAAHPLTVTGGTGQRVESPTAPGTYSATAGSQVLGVNGASYSFFWSAAQSTWFLS